MIRLEPSFLKEVEEQENPLKEIELQIEQLYRLIQQLPRQQQKIYSLHKLQNYSYKEIATRGSKLSKLEICSPFS